MTRWLRRFFRLGLLTGAGLAVYRFVGQRQRPQTDSSWARQPTAERPASAPSSSTVAAQTAEAAARWVAAVDGKCPDGYPIKVNENSGIFHVPGGRFYDRTAPERCYATAEEALADGYRPAKA
jgi:hypothetical protein